MSDTLLRLCTHRALDGSLCQQPAMRQSQFCRHHDRFHPLPKPIILPGYIYEVTDNDSMLNALRRAMQGYHDGRLDNKTFIECCHHLNRDARLRAKSRRIRSSLR